MDFKRFRYLVLVGILYLGITISFNNCTRGSGTAPSSESTHQPVEGLDAVNYFRESVPSTFCGQDGYGYLLRSYLGPECGSCHSMNGGTFPPFGDNDLSKAYSYGRTMGKAKFLELSTNNRFCGPDCNLDTRGEIYQALNQWFDHTDSCN